MSLFEGVYPAVLTPFDSSGAFNPRAYGGLIDHFFEVGVHGLYVCGVSGEGLMMSPEEREHVAEFAMAASKGRGKVLVHVGCGNTRNSKRLARHAAKIKADGVSCLAPYTDKYGIESLVRHYSRVAEAAHPLPMLVYYTPQVSPSLNTYVALERLLNLECVAGVKFTGTDAADFAFVMYERSAQQTVFSGVDEMFLAALLMGAHGAVGSMVNVVPELFVRIYGLAKEGKWLEANESQRHVMRFIRAVEGFPFLSALKCIVSWQGYECGEPREPQLSLTPEQRAELRRSLESLGMRFYPGKKISRSTDSF